MFFLKQEWFGSGFGEHAMDLTFEQLCLGSHGNPLNAGMKPILATRIHSIKAPNFDFWRVFASN
jgi:hypothetical protein